MKHVLLFLATVGFLLFAANGVWAQEEAPGNKLLVILDSSSVMAGNIHGASKLDIERDALRELLIGWNKADELGIVAYGGAKADECGEAREILPLVKPEPGNFNKAFKLLNPSGKASLNEALKLAHKIDSSIKQKNQIVLIAGAKEACGDDPCKVVKELRRGDPKFVVNVVGFDVANKEEREQLECIAENSNGLFYTASDASALSGVMQRIREQMTNPNGVRFTAGVQEESPLNIDINWHIFKSDGGKEVELFDRTDPQPLLPLNPGKYRVRCEYGDVSAEKKFEVTEGARRNVFVPISFGQLSLRASLTAAGRTIDSGLLWRVYKGTKPNQSGNSLVVEGYDRATFSLPSGDYLVELRYESITAQKNIHVDQNKNSTEVFVLDGGEVTLRAYENEGGDILENGVTWRIYRYEEEQVKTGEQNVFARAYNRAQTALPAGKYLIEGIYGLGHVSRTIDVKPGQAIKEDFVLGIGGLELVSLLADGADPLNAGTVWRLYPAEDRDKDAAKRKLIAEQQNIVKVSLPAGRYYVEAKNDNAFVSGNVEVVAGKVTKEQFVFSAGRAELKAYASQGGELLNEGVIWRIYKAEDILSGSEEPEIVCEKKANDTTYLQKGKYVADVFYNDKTVQVEFSIKANETSVVEAILEAGQKSSSPAQLPLKH